MDIVAVALKLRLAACWHVPRYASVIALLTVEHTGIPATSPFEEEVHASTSSKVLSCRLLAHTQACEISCASAFWGFAGDRASS
jgi:hypothetical protein